MVQLICLCFFCWSKVSVQIDVELALILVISRRVSNKELGSYDQSQDFLQKACMTNLHFSKIINHGILFRCHLTFDYVFFHISDNWNYREGIPHTHKFTTKRSWEFEPEISTLKIKTLFFPKFDSVVTFNYVITFIIYYLFDLYPTVIIDNYK